MTAMKKSVEEEDVALRANQTLSPDWAPADGMFRERRPLAKTLLKILQFPTALNAKIFRSGRLAMVETNNNYLRHNPWAQRDFKSVNMVTFSSTTLGFGLQSLWKRIRILGGFCQLNGRIQV